MKHRHKVKTVDYVPSEKEKYWMLEFCECGDYRILKYLWTDRITQICGRFDKWLTIEH